MAPNDRLNIAVERDTSQAGFAPPQTLCASLNKDIMNEGKYYAWLVESREKSQHFNLQLYEYL